MVQIQKKGKISFENQELKIPYNQVGDFLLASVSEQIFLEDKLTLSELMNVLFHLKGFVKDYFLEEYDALNTLVSSGLVVEPISEIVIYKELIISSEGDLIFIPKIRTVKKDFATEGYQDVIVSISNKVLVHDEFGFTNKDKKISSPITLLDLLGAVFEDFKDYVTVSLGNH